ncbi:tRNA (adenosine(37)-N6)-threonylcarbamoyltransferase complex dimerization subunit type 1 TsaB [Sphingobacterium spiritivorum]|uniref:tRNA (adenosine(37)-N6)-threonylcarbamoyltransferase complex dimerization subunit type 1 TsaB n=1 Tax=Sphingobacterium spiritivorum TaxID=258 RepID=UPI00191ADC21|nr:tRNA (adenosine(37)-N6)-threonylcarbamoyltransferase complex dimerization subunit type 1 TsaB [Sphingobacterium spiritivorum]QQT24328.1 tRNA (adenosine(37)-N6)-threonylcarbamoyltransferase complex dimerization subunit type 1 TsaB [Sphingobacterium spiritivorum]
MNKNYILQIETATPACSVAVSLDGHVITTVGAEENNIHATHLTVFIEKALQDAGITIQDLRAVAVSMGPGSYTGLRIGVSAAKGLCYALDIPLIAIDTLSAMFNGFLQKGIQEDKKVLYCPMIDARRMEVYSALYDQNGHQVVPVGANVIDQDFFHTYEADGYHLHLFGSGAPKFKTLFEANPLIRVYDDFSNSADYMTYQAFEKMNNESFEDVAYFEPYYLKDFVATTPKKR